MTRSNSINDFSRRRPTRKARDTVLIVCEGSKTEPNYFDELISDLQLSSTDIKIYGKECGTDPLNVVDFALQTYRKTSGGFDYVFCIIDRDTHRNFNPALVKVASTRLRSVKRFDVIWSDPCFEYWLLLHFGYTAKPYNSTSRLSRCEACVKDLEKVVGKYSKGIKGSFELTKARYEDAVTYAARREKECATENDYNPSTKVHELTELLRDISRQAQPS